jgi:hypothetical protein
VAERETARRKRRVQLSPELGLEEGVFEPRVASPSHRQADDLHICPACSSALVFPTDWAPARDRHWRVALRCPDCEWRGGGVYSQDVVDRLDEALDHGTELMLDDLTILARANMEQQVSTFVTALQADLILPEDF